MSGDRGSQKNVSKKFCRSLKRSMLYGMEDISRDLLHLPNTSDKLRKDEFWAVDDVSYKVANAPRSDAPTRECMPPL